MSDEQKPSAPPMKLVRMSHFGLAAASRIWGRERAIEMFDQRRVPHDGEILAVAPEDVRAPKR